MARFASGEESEKFDAQIPIDKISETVDRKILSKEEVITSSFETYKRSVENKINLSKESLVQEIHETKRILHNEIYTKSTQLLNYVIPLLVILQKVSRFWIFRFINLFVKWYRIDKETGDVIYYIPMDTYSSNVKEFNITKIIQSRTNP